MRQGGFKPKNHNSGIYWVRANSGGNGEDNSERESTPLTDALAIIAALTVFVVLVVIYS